LEKHTPESNRAMLVDLYRKLVDIARQQADCLLNQADELAIDTYNRLANEWAGLTRNIDEIMQKGELPTIDRTEIQGLLKQLSEYQSVIEDNIQKRYDSLTWSMRALKHHQIVLHAYGHIGTKDIVPLYFDEKK
jgi:hypothetical protein